MTDLLILDGCRIMAGQILAAISMNIAVVQAQSEKLDSRGARAVSENARLVKQVSSEIRTISHLLHPPLLEVAGVILAIRIVFFEFKSRSFIPLVIASTLATAVHMQLLGSGPHVSGGAVDFWIPHALPFYLLLGPLCGLAAAGLSKVLYWVEDFFEDLPVNELWRPAIGALALGAIGFFVPRVFKPR